MAFAPTRLEVARWLAFAKPVVVLSAAEREAKARLMLVTVAFVIFAGVLPVAVTRDQSSWVVSLLPEM
jgi:hypothetical protein